VTAAIEGPTFSGNPDSGIRADRVSAAVDAADAMLAAELVVAAVERSGLVFAFGVLCDGDEAYLGEVTS
jgi:hypothetical protein